MIIQAVNHNALFVKETPPAPRGSSDQLIKETDIFYKTEHEVHPGGDVLGHLLTHRDPPPTLAVRLHWACNIARARLTTNIAEGLAYLHSRGVIWVDVSLQNVLLTSGNRALLCDFAGSCIYPITGAKPVPVEYTVPQISLNPMMAMPKYSHMLEWDGPGSGSPYAVGNVTPHHDRFGFGVLLFCLAALRFVHSPNLVVRDPETFEKIYSFHRAERFDTLGDVKEYAALETIIQKCFRAQYASSDELFGDMKAAAEAMPPDSPLLQDRVQDPIIQFLPRKPGRAFYPFDLQEQEFNEEFLADL
ncbi:hypothetical protein GGX14DRAFT_458278 [Mycena pura]|uniref:Protein kinase domain-containing protein n=1 Tax=Mycena pura TaxID=153505 RepID=A0AAD6YEU9_9AGAR|nr:hypothetical protein GGX14DRAFT_458278 [Mycena pura]